MRSRTVALVLVSFVGLVALTTFWVSAWVSMGCCSMDPERYPAVYAAARRRGEQAGRVAVVALAATGGSIVAAALVVIRFPKRAG